MSNPNDQPNDLRGMVRTRRRRNNRHTTFSARERPSTRHQGLPQPWTFISPTGQSVPQTKTAQPHYPEAANHNPAGAPHSLPQQSANNQTATQPTNQPTTPPISTNNNNIVIPIFTQPHPTNNPATPIPETQQTPPPEPHLHPSSPAHSIKSENLEDIDLRSPADDPDYDFIDAAEATHSARNAQPDRADKYREQDKGVNVEGVAGDGKEGKAVEAKAAEAKKGKGWFSYFK